MRIPLRQGLAFLLASTVAACATGTSNVPTVRLAGADTIVMPSDLVGMGRTSLRGRGLEATPASYSVVPTLESGNIFVAFFSGSAVSGFHNVNRRWSDLCAVSGVKAVWDVGVDSKGNLWIPEPISETKPITSIVNEYAPNCGSLITTLSDPDGQAVSIVFDKKATAYVENIDGTGGVGTLGSIDVYPKGATKPSTELVSSVAFLAIGEAVDAQGNVFMAYSTPGSSGGVVEFPRGTNPGTILPIGITFPGGVILDKNGNLLVTDPNIPVIKVYPQPYNKGPSTEITLKGFSNFCKFNRLQTHIYCADYGSTPGRIDVYSYNAASPGASRYLYSRVMSIEPNGIALSPPAPVNP